MKCPNCGAEIIFDDKKTVICKYCGTEVHNENEKKENKTDFNASIAEAGTAIEKAVDKGLNFLSKELGGAFSRISAKEGANKNTDEKSCETEKNGDSEKKNKVAPANKIVSLILCILGGYLGLHKFYEGKVVLGIVYILTFGLFGIGWLIDIIIIANKPNPYYPN